MITHRIRPTPRGMLLVEAVLYVALAVTVLASAATLYATALSVHTRDEARSAVTEPATIVLLEIARAVRGATSVTAPVSGTTGSEIVLSGAVGGAETATYRVTNGAFVLQEGSGPETPLTPPDSIVSDLSIQNLGTSSEDSSLRIEFMMTRSNVGGRPDAEYSARYSVTVTNRN